MKTIWYFGLEPLKERYTYQLSNIWMPEAFAAYSNEYNFVNLKPVQSGDKINVGVVLDAVGRGKWAMDQCALLLDGINSGAVKDNDIIFLQDFWTPGIESVFYALDLYGIKNVKVFSMLHAQSVDEYDFTHSMKDWMRPFELGIDKRMSGIFVGSTIHKEQLRQAGFTAPIHVVSLPLHLQDVLDTAPEKVARKNNVIFTSRFDKEKNPYFLMKVIKNFLEENKDWTFTITTSGTSIRSNLKGVAEDFYALAELEPRFKIKTGLTKEDYYYELKSSKIQFNCSLQDYVSWTALEANAFGCVLVYPDFRCFTEMHDITFKYYAFDTASAGFVLNQATDNYKILDKGLAQRADLGRRLEAFIVCTDYTGPELNVWHEQEYITKLLTN